MKIRALVVVLHSTLRFKLPAQVSLLVAAITQVGVSQDWKFLRIYSAEPARNNEFGSPISGKEPHRESGGAIVQ